MQQENYAKIDWKPRCIEKSEQAIAGNKLADVGQVGKCLSGIGAGAPQVSFESGSEYPVIQRCIKAGANPDQ